MDIFSNTSRAAMTVRNKKRCGFQIFCVKTSWDDTEGKQHDRSDKHNEEEQETESAQIFPDEWIHKLLAQPLSKWYESHRVRQIP